MAPVSHPRVCYLYVPGVSRERVFHLHLPSLSQERTSRWGWWRVGVEWVCCAPGSSRSLLVTAAIPTWIVVTLKIGCDGRRRGTVRCGLYGILSFSIVTRVQTRAPRVDCRGYLWLCVRVRALRPQRVHAFTSSGSPSCTFSRRVPWARRSVCPCMAAVIFHSFGRSRRAGCAAQKSNSSSAR